MPTEAQRTTGDDGALPKRSEPLSSAVPEATAEVPPTGHIVTDTWAEAADATGTVKADREMPEPDSLGG
jgi:hypothetical protein